MNTSVGVLRPLDAPPGGRNPANLRALVNFYTETDADYGAWSRGFNMHFGYFEPGMNPLDRESMLDRMNVRVLERLALPDGPAPRVADLGCGTGATARALVLTRPGSLVSAVTIVPAQIERGKALNARNGAGDAIRYVHADYTKTGLPAAAYDAVCAVESACHAAGADKRYLLVEAHRLLKTGGRIVIADCFLRHRGPLGWLVGRAYRRWCESWAVPELAEVHATRDTLHRLGFVDIEFTDISWNVAPSVAHVPWVATRFLVAELWSNRGRLTAWRRRHVVASWLSVFLGLCRGSFGYYMVSARKAG